VMDSFVQTADMLRSISVKELSQSLLSEQETAFLQHIVEENYVGERTYTGWYPELFYEPAKEYIPPDPDIRPDGDDK